MQSKLNNLLFLIESLSGGGAEKVLTTLLQHLDSNKFDVTLCCIVDCGKYVNDVKPYVHYFYIAQSRTNKRNKETDLSTQIQINLFVASVTIGLQMVCSTSCRRGDRFCGRICN